MSNPLLNLLCRDVKGMDDIGIHNAYPARGYGPHGEFLPARHSKFANHQDVEGGLQGTGDLEADGNAASRQGKHKNTVTTRKLTQP